MIVPAEAQQKIEDYLATLRQGLRGLKREDAREIVDELRSHIVDKASASGAVTLAGVEAALQGLGSPGRLASQYLSDQLLPRADASRSPVRILSLLFRWAAISIAGFFVLVASVVGYFLGASFLLCALLKTIHPKTAGLWFYSDAAGNPNYSLRLGFSAPPPAARELLGWWIIPAGLFLGCLLVLGTSQFAVWCARSYRKRRRLP